MKATLKDKSALLALEPAMLLKYLEKHEWEFMEDVTRDDEVIGHRYKIYNKDSHRWCYVKHIFDSSLPDYAARMAENLYEIELANDKSQLQIYADIMGEIIIYVPADMSMQFDKDVLAVMEDLK